MATHLLPDLLRVWSASLLTLVGVTMLDVELVLKIVLLTITIAYTAWRFVRDFLDRQHSKTKR